MRRPEMIHKTEDMRMPESIREDRFSKRLTRGAPLAAVVLVVCGTGLFLIYKLLPVLELIAVAMLLALGMRTIVRGLNSIRVPGWMSVIILLTITVVLGSLVWFVIVPNVLQEIQKLVSAGPGSLQAVANLFDRLPIIPDMSQFSDRLRDYISGMISSLPTLLYATGSAIAAVLAVVFLALYFAVDPGSYIAGILRLVPRDRRAGINEFMNRVGERLRGWIVGVVLVASFIGVGGGLGLWILGAPLPLTFGLIAGLLNVIPFMGSIVGGALPALLALTVSPFKAIEVVVLFLVLNQIEAHLLQPLIMGREIRVSTAVVIVAFLVLGELLGPIIGAFLAVPATVVVSVVVDELAESRPSLGYEEEKTRAAEKEERDEP